MKKSDNNRKNAAPVMDISYQLSEKYAVLKNQYRFVGFVRERFIVKSKHNARYNLNNYKERCHAPQAKSAVERQGAAVYKLRMNVKNYSLNTV